MEGICRPWKARPESAVSVTKTSGAKAATPWGFFGTTEVVPFPVSLAVNGYAVTGSCNPQPDNSGCLLHRDRHVLYDLAQDLVGLLGLFQG